MKYSKEEQAEALDHGDLVELYVGLRELCGRREEELDALWVYVEWEAEGMIQSNQSPDEDGRTDPRAYHRIMENAWHVWPSFLLARVLRRERDPELFVYYGEPESP